MGQIIIISMICLSVLIPIAFATPPEQPGFWPVTGFTFGLDSTPVVADIDNDGQFEIVVNAKGTVVVLRPDGSRFPGWNLPRIGDYVSPVAVGDVNGDGVLEIVAASAYPDENSGIYVFDSKGNILPGWPVKGSLSPVNPFFPVLADLDNDGAAEIITVAAAYKGNGQIVQRWGLLLYPKTPPPPAVADIDNDGSPEVIIVVSPKVYAFKANGTLIPGWGINIYHSDAAPVIGDLNKDGNLEVIVNALGTIYVFNAKGTILPGWPVSVPNKPPNEASRESSPAIGDLDGDGTLEIVIQSHEQQAVYAFNYRGQMMPGWPVNLGASVNSLYSHPVLGDIDGDGTIEVLIVSQTASHQGGDNMYAYNADGVREMGWWPDRSWPAHVKENIFTPTISEIDGDGHVEILCSSLDAIYCYDMGPNTYCPDYLDWPMFRANASRTGFYNSPSTVEPSPPVTEPLVIVYDFSDNNLGPWKPINGQWEIKEGVYNAPATNLNYHEITAISDRNWKDYVVETKFRFVQFIEGREAEAHLYFRFGSHGYYGIRVINRGSIDNPNWNIEFLKSTDKFEEIHVSALRMHLQTNVWYGMRVRAAESTFDISFFDGKLWRKISTLNSDELKHGGIGLGKAAASVQFDDVKVYGEDINPFPLAFAPAESVIASLVKVYNFDNDNPGPWQPVGGVWEIKNGVYDAPAIDLHFHEYTEIGDRRDWRDYIVETKFKLVELASGGRGADVQLVFRRSKEGSYAVRVIDRNPDIHNWRIEYMRWTDGYAKYHEGLLAALNMQLSLNVWYGLRVRAIGNTFGVDFFDGSSWLKVGAFSDNELNYGGIGLGKAAAHVQFDDVKIYGEGIKDSPPPSERTLSIILTEASPGAKVTVQLSITDATGLAAGDIMVKYDASVITVGEVKGTELISGLNLIVNKDVPGEIKLPMAGTKGIPSGSGALVEIELTVSKDAKVGTETTLSFGDAKIYDESGAVIPINLENGVVKITQQGIKGDVNNDGKVRSNDAMLALRIAAGLIEPSDYQKWAADMNDDGKIRSNDAMLILRKAAGLAAPDIQTVAVVNSTITIMLGETHGVAGESVTAPLIVDNVYDLASGDICITYDDAVLRAVEVTTKDGVVLQSNIAESGMVRIAFASAERLNSKTVAEIQFEILADDISPLTLQLVELYQSDVLLVDSRRIDGLFSSWAIPPEHSALLQNFPNPFNPETWIPYKLAQDSEVTISIYDGKGQLVRLIPLGVKPAGVYLTKDRAVYWDGRNYQGERVANGLYFYQLKAGDFNATRRMIIVK